MVTLTVFALIKLFYIQPPRRDENTQSGKTLDISFAPEVVHRRLPIA